jgi:hypothetical protein
MGVWGASERLCHRCGTKSNGNEKMSIVRWNTSERPLIFTTFHYCPHVVFALPRHTRPNWARKHDDRSFLTIDHESDGTLASVSERPPLNAQ